MISLSSSEHKLKQGIHRTFNTTASPRVQGAEIFIRHCVFPSGGITDDAIRRVSSLNRYINSIGS